MHHIVKKNSTHSQWNYDFTQTTYKKVKTYSTPERNYDFTLTMFKTVNTSGTHNGIMVLL